MRKIVFTVILLFVTALCGFSFCGQEQSTVKAYDAAHNLYLKGKYTEAEKEYQNFIKNNPESLLKVTALYYMAKCCAGNKDYNKAVSYYNEVITGYKTGFWADSAKEEIARIKKESNK